MNNLIRILLVLTVNFYISTISYALPPKVEADRLMLETGTLIEGKQWDKALVNLEKIKSLKIQLPNAFYYQYAIALIENGQYQKGKENLDKYLTNEGDKAKFYKEALLAYNAVEKMSNSGSSVSDKSKEKQSSNSQKTTSEVQNSGNSSKICDTCGDEGLAPIKTQGKWGYINKQGKLVIEAKFIRAKPFSEGLACVQVFTGNEYLYGFIDKTGNMTIKPQFTDADSFSEGLAPVKIGEQWAYIDKQAKNVISVNVSRASSFHEGLAKVYVANELNSTGAFGYINKQGDFAIKPQYDEADDFSNGLAVIRLNGKMGYIDKQGTIRAEMTVGVVYSIHEPFKLLQFNSFSSGLAPFCIDWKKCGFINRKGDVRIRATYDFATPFSEDLAAVEVNGKWGFIDKEGIMVISPQFDDADFFIDNLAKVKMNGLYGYIDKKGNMVIPAKFDDGDDFCRKSDLILN